MYEERLKKILDEIEVPLVCPKCRSKKITYKEVKTKKRGLIHVGAYCENKHFIKWVKQNDEVLKKIENKNKLF